MKPDVQKMIQQLSLMWETTSLFCPLIFCSLFATNISGFNVNWMLHQFDLGISLAQQGLALIRNETATFLTPPKPPKSSRQRRGLTMGLAAFAAGAFRWGTCCRCFRFMWLTRELWKLSTSIQGKRRKCTSPG